MQLDLGILAKPLHEQLQCDPTILENIENLRNAVNLLRVQQIITRGESASAERRLIKKLISVMSEHGLHNEQTVVQQKYRSDKI